MEHIDIPQDYLDQIKEETKLAIQRGWDASKSAWRIMALRVLLETCLANRKFTVNDFRSKIKDSDIKTHDNRAMGGLMATAKNWGWIESVDAIPSKVGHRTPIQVWKSKIYQELSGRERSQQLTLI